MRRLYIGSFPLGLCVLVMLAACRKRDNTYFRELEEQYIAQLQLEETAIAVTTLVNNLEVPWEIAWGSDGYLWMTEQNGQVSRVDPASGDRKVMLRVPDVHFQKSRGLLGMALHPDLDRQPYIYLHYTFLVPDPGMRKVIYSRLVRYTWEGDTLTTPLVLLDSIPGNTYHNGSRVLISPDEKLFLATGDAGHVQKAQAPDALEGKILRMNLDGSVPEDNPYPGNRVWSMGHRNVQGLVWAKGRLYASEHGPANDDEINWIRKGRNYGWPDVQGFCDRENEASYCREHDIVEPLRAWTPTLAVAGLDYYDNPIIKEWQGSLLSVNLKGRALRVLRLSENGEAIREEKIYFQNFLGRIRDLCVAPNGDIFLATSNRDWHPRLQSFMYDPDMIKPDDDRIVRLRAGTPRIKRALVNRENRVYLREDPEPLPLESEKFVADLDTEELEEGAALYQTHCALCHRPDGKGVEDLYPPLVNTPWVTGNKDRLIATVMRGLSEPIEVQGKVYADEMPGYAHLSNEEVAAILTFIRSQWGNASGPINASEVEEERRAM